MSDVFNGYRLETIRRIYGLSQSEFGSRVGIGQSRLSRIEQGELPLSLELASRVSELFSEPLAFFRVPTNPVPLGPAAFRRKSATRASDKHRIVALFEEAARVFHRASAESSYREMEPSLERDFEPEDAARAVRAFAGIPRLHPVKNVTRLIERLGVGVITQLDDTDGAQDISEVSGISMPTSRNRRPLIATNPIARGDVQRLTLAHEFGHLIFDQDAPTISCAVRSPQERTAFEFGAALLIPREAVEGRIHERSTLADFLELKGEYGISASAIVGRAASLGVISRDRKRNLHIQHSSRGWRYHEPVEVAVERPLLLQQALTKIFPKATFARASHDFAVRPERLRRWAARLEAELPTSNITPLPSRN